MPEALDEASSLLSFRAQIGHQNLELLSDEAPWVRARAHRWLLAQGKAPAGFKPLASFHERRAVLEGQAR